MFKRAGASVVLLGDNLGEIGGSEYLALIHGQVAGMPPALDLKREAALQKLIVRAIRDGLVESAHDCSDGGLAVALAECTFDSGNVGVTADLPLASESLGAVAANATLFGESASRIVVSVGDDKIELLLAAARSAGIPATVIGKTGGDRIKITVGGAPAIDRSIAEAEQAWATTIDTRMRSGNVR
jgi:phosphoribosylformylglycinamidine synthase